MHFAYKPLVWTCDEVSYISHSVAPFSQQGSFFLVMLKLLVPTIAVLFFGTLAKNSSESNFLMAYLAIFTTIFRLIYPTKITHQPSGYFRRLPRRHFVPISILFFLLASSILFPISLAPNLPPTLFLSAFTMSMAAFVSQKIIWMNSVTDLPVVL